MGEYLDRYKLQTFCTDMIMYVAKHFPPDPYDFLLDHISSMVMKHRAGTAMGAGVSESKDDAPPTATARPEQVVVTQEQRQNILQHIAMALRHDNMAATSAGKFFDKFVD